MGIDVTNFYIYRWRYYIGYALVVFLLVGMLTFAGLYVPGGISDSEKIAVIKSSSISITNISSLGTTNAPYYLLQQASMKLFGASDFSIKLPSLILGFLTAGGLILLLKRWFKPRIALIASLIAVTTGQFLFIAQNGTPSILYVLWPVLLLLLGTLIAKKAKFRLAWKLLFFSVAALSLYTPLSIYALIALGASIILHPHLRFIVRSLSRPQLAIGFVLALIIVAPLALGIIASPGLGLMLLGIPSDIPNFLANATALSNQYLGFPLPSTTILMTPVFGLGSALIILIGFYRLIRTRESTQSYLVIIWLVCLIPILVTNPMFTSVTFLPLVLLLATGLTSLISYWYRLFPRNPYARIAGLVPIIILVSSLVLSGLERYTYGYYYDPHAAPNFSQDLSLLPKNTTELVVSNNELPFYVAVATFNPKLKVTTAAYGTEFVVTRDAYHSVTPFRVDRIITSSALNQSDRFYVYKNS
jgi:voltage-gated potassium channel Kch